MNQIDQVEALTGQRVRRAHVDRGYRGDKLERQDLTLVISHTQGILSPTICREMRRRNAIEPVIGDLKSDGLMERNRLKGASGDKINVTLTTAGHNLRLLLACIRLSYAWILAAITAALNGPYLTRRPTYAQV